MTDYRRTDSGSELVDIIHQVRRRWRIKLALRGALGVVGLGILVLILSAYGLESWRFSAGAIITFRVIVAAALAALIGYPFVRPLMRKASDEQVALYLEEHEPSLQAAIISAVEAEHGGSGSPYSATLVRRLVESAVEKVREIDDGRRVERVPVRRYSATLAAVTVAALALFTLGPAYLRHALSALLIVSRDVEAAALQHRSHAWQRDRRARRGPEHHRASVGIRCRTSVADGAQDARRGIRARAAPARR